MGSCAASYRLDGLGKRLIEGIDWVVEWWLLDRIYCRLFKGQKWICDLENSGVACSKRVFVKKEKSNLCVKKIQ